MRYENMTRQNNTESKVMKNDGIGDDDDDNEIEDDNDDNETEVTMAFVYLGLAKN